jgi:Phage tail assembly chaperone proteins, E, or 41 or 14
VSGSDWEPVPEPMTWALPAPISYGSKAYTEITLRAPTSGQLEQAQEEAKTNLQVMQALIEAVSGVPIDVVKQVPDWMTAQMAAYFEEFHGAPAPGPLDQWRKRRAAREKANVEAAASSSTGTGESRTSAQP